VDDRKISPEQDGLRNGIHMRRVLQI